MHLWSQACSGQAAEVPNNPNDTWFEKGKFTIKDLENAYELVSERQDLREQEYLQNFQRSVNADSLEKAKERLENTVLARQQKQRQAEAAAPAAATASSSSSSQAPEIDRRHEGYEFFDEDAWSEPPQKPLNEAQLKQQEFSDPLNPVPEDDDDDDAAGKETTTESDKEQRDSTKTRADIEALHASLEGKPYYFLEFFDNQFAERSWIPERNNRVFKALMISKDAKTEDQWQTSVVKENQLASLFVKKIHDTLAMGAEKSAATLTLVFLVREDLFLFLVFKPATDAAAASAAATPMLLTLQQFYYGWSSRRAIELLCRVDVEEEAARLVRELK